MIDQLYEASLTGDSATFSAALKSASQQFVASPEGQAWELEVQRYGEDQRALEAERQRQQLEQQRLLEQQQVQESAHRSHVRRM